MSTWINGDGLEVRFGNTQATVAAGGELDTRGDVHEVRLKVTGTDVPSTDAPIYKHVGIPQGAWIEEAKFYVTTAFASGGAATLDLGIMADDGDGTFSTEDDDGIDAAVAVTAIDAAGDVITCNGALVGAQIGTESHGRPYVFSFGYGTAAFTAGVGELVVKYRVSNT